MRCALVSYSLSPLAFRLFCPASVYLILMLNLLAALCLWTLVPGVPLSVLSAFRQPQIFDCAERGGDLAHVWLHPADSGLRAVLCRHDPFPGWSESLWLLDLRNAAAPDVVVEIPLHGTGVASFAWLACPGEPLAHVVDRTHMGTVTDRVFRLGEGGRLGLVDRRRPGPGTSCPRTSVPCPR